jgi:glycosyltransferase involved in cell wall biosynthesis
MVSCEVRVTTYKRPQLLARSLNSLIAQTHQDWQALIFDDSPEREGELVVQSLGDPRLLYRPHPQNLGQTKNLDYAFQSAAYIGGKYAFVLEDDNYLMPEFIASNIGSLEAHNVSIVLRNQQFRYEEAGESIYRGETTRSRWFNQGCYEPLQLYARLFFCEGISNGGLFWRTDTIQSNLQVGSQVADALHQELFRTLRIQEPIVFESEPLCVYTFFPRPRGKGLRQRLRHTYRQIGYNRGMQSILLFLKRIYGAAIVEEAQAIAMNADAQELLEQRLLKIFYLDYEFRLIKGLQATHVLAKHLLRYHLFRDPYRRVLAD